VYVWCVVCVGICFCVSAVYVCVCVFFCVSVFVSFVRICVDHFMHVVCNL